MLLYPKPRLRLKVLSEQAMEDDRELMSLRNMALAAALGMSLLFHAGCKTEQPPIKKIAAIDETVIYDLEMFKKADEELSKWREDEYKKRGEAVKGKSDEEKAKAFQEFQAELEIKTNEKIKPLKDKARAAVASTAAKHGIEVMLDKKIVVYGVDDLTEEVKTLLTSGSELTFPEEKPDQFDKAPVGYFDPSVVRSLKVFKEAEGEVMAERDRMLKAIGEQLEKAKNEGNAPSPAEIQAMQKQVEARLAALQEQKMAPLVKAVTDSVEDVAKSEGLSLVVDTQHVMYGGRNLTENVVERFLKRVSGKVDEPGASPTPDAAPAGE